MVAPVVHPRIIVAVANGAAIARRNPDAIVADIDACCFRRGSDQVVLHKQTAAKGVGNQAFLVSLALLSKCGETCFREDIEVALWGPDLDGGPLNPAGCVSVYLMTAKKVLAWAGYDVRAFRLPARYAVEPSPAGPEFGSLGLSSRAGVVSAAHVQRWNDRCPGVKARRALRQRSIFPSASGPLTPRLEARTSQRAEARPC